MSRVFKVDYIADPDRGRPLWNAKIYVGIPNEDPTIPSNQIQLTGDIGFPVGQSIPVPQPVRTNKGGVTVYNNSPLDLNAPGQQYAIAIYDRNDNLIYNFPQVDGSVAMNTTSQEEVTGLTIWPEVGEAVIGQTIPAGTDAIRYPFNGRSTLFTIKPPVAVTGLITDITINSSGIGTLEVDNSDVYDLAEFNSYVAANDGDSQLAGGAIWPLSSQDSTSVSDSFSNYNIFRINSGGELRLYESNEFLSGTVDSIGPDGDVIDLVVSGTTYQIRLIGSMLNGYANRKTPDIGDSLIGIESVTIGSVQYPLSKSLSDAITEINLTADVPYIEDGTDRAYLLNISTHSKTQVNTSAWWTKGTGLEADDDGSKLNLAADQARDLRQRYFISSIHYTSENIDLTNVTEIDGNGSTPIPYFDERDYMGSPLGTCWHNKTIPERPWELFIELLSGSAIVSRDPIVIVTHSEGVCLPRNFGVYGSIHADNQVGWNDGAARVGTGAYRPTIRGFHNITIECCGSGNNVTLLNGIEFFHLEACNINHSEGLGIYITRSDESQPIDYSVGESNHCQNNREGNLFLDGCRISFAIDGINVSRPGKYQHYLDMPNNIQDIKAGVTIVTKFTGWIAQGLNLNNVAGESVQVLLKLVSQSTEEPLGVLKDLKGKAFFQGIYPEPEFVGKPSVGILLEGNFFEDISFEKFETNADDYIGYVGSTPANQIIIDYPEEWSTFGLNPYLNKKAEPYTNKNLLADYTNSPNGGAGMQFSDAIKPFHPISNYPDNQGIPKSMWMLSSNFQSSGSTSGGTYLLSVHRGGNGDYHMDVLPFSSTSGFTAPPTMATDGRLTVNIDAFYQWTLSRIDILGTAGIIE